MKEGESESFAYEDFGKRIGLRSYMKLSSLITQNLRMGTGGMGKILDQEMREAFEDRKAYAKTRGEEASTKLLIPMLMLMGIVMLIVMVPGFMSFSGSLM